MSVHSGGYVRVPLHLTSRAHTHQTSGCPTHPAKALSWYFLVVSLQFVRRVTLLLLPLFACSLASAQDFESPPLELEHAEPKSLELRNVRLLAWQIDHKNRKYVEVSAFRESKTLHLIPADKFDVACEVVGGFDVLPGDYFLWTSVDFLVAPVTRAFEEMDDSKLASSVGWGQVMEMRDLKSTPIYFLQPGNVRRVVIRDLGLGTVLAAFPVGDPSELWPWLLRVTVHVQDRSGKLIATAQKVLRLSPASARKLSHYNDPLPSR